MEKDAKIAEQHMMICALRKTLNRKRLFEIYNPYYPHEYNLIVHELLEKFVCHRFMSKRCLRHATTCKRIHLFLAPHLLLRAIDVVVTKRSITASSYLNQLIIAISGWSSSCLFRMFLSDVKSLYERKS